MYFYGQAGLKNNNSIIQLLKSFFKCVRYGFVENPVLMLTVTPQVGVKEVVYTSVTEWIADRIKLELQVRVEHQLLENKTGTIDSTSFFFLESSGLTKHG